MLRKRSDWNLHPAIEVSSTDVVRGRPFRVDATFLPRRPTPVDVTVLVRKIEVVTSSSGSDFKKWDHPTVVLRKDHQQIVAPPGDRLEFVLQIPEIEEPRRLWIEGGPFGAWIDY